MSEFMVIAGWLYTDLGEVLVDGGEHVPPVGLLQQHTQVSVSVPATLHTLTHRNAVKIFYTRVQQSENT